MAKSLRSHKKTQHRALKRSKPSSDYAKAETSRTQRLADKLKASGLKSKVVAKKEEDEEGEGIEEGDYCHAVLALVDPDTLGCVTRARWLDCLLDAGFPPGRLRSGTTCKTDLEDALSS